MAIVDVDGSCQFSADSRPKSFGLIWGLAATRRSIYIYQMNRWTLAMFLVMMIAPWTFIFNISIIIFLTPVLNSQGMKKNTLCNTKSTNQAGMNLTPPPPSQNYYYYIFDAVVRFKIDTGFSPSLGLCTLPTATLSSLEVNDLLLTITTFCMLSAIRLRATTPHCCVANIGS